MIFTSTTPWKPRNVKFFQKVRNWQNWILSVPRVSICREKNCPGFVNISPTLVIDTSTERSSRVLQHGNQKIWFFFSKKFEIEFDLYFDLCWRAEIIQVGLNMHLSVDIGDASSSLRGSTSSFKRIKIRWELEQLAQIYFNFMFVCNNHFALPCNWVNDLIADSDRKWLRWHESPS